MNEGEISTGGDYQSHTSDGFTVSSNTETTEAIKDNFSAEEKPKDGDAPDPEKEEADAVSKAAAKLGEKGGKAAAEKRASEAEEKDEAKSEEKEPEEKLGKPRHDPRARMLEATREAAEAKRQLAEERRERERLTAEVREIRNRVDRPQEQRPQEQARAKDSRPQSSDYENYEKFTEDLAEWKANETWKARKDEATRQYEADQYARGVATFQQTFIGRMAEARKSDPDLDARISASEVAQLSPSYVLPRGTEPTIENHIADELMASEMAPALLNYLASDTEEWARLKGLRNKREVAREVAKLEVKLSEAQAPKGPRLVSSKAPPPIKPLTGAPPPVDDLDDDTPFEVHMRKMNARDRQRKAGR